ncbi:hypothetical protein [Homoserinibacter sp. YIM 151385]|uniref:hypothetical protein n=1 Tax=Homoserinibacter sp. YIM 151385 TaxID=2985506 RepID=UPI0022F0DFF7|nr:hypothetical protein [Homoserinibacter sp. YIM 151385]WBU38108.1 hypothetical protein OF852_00560 [Homoserinibacter sp. YIM 151385]
MSRGPWFSGVIAALFLVLGILNSALSVGFGRGSGWELLWSFGLTLDFLAIAVVLGIVTVVRVKRSRLPKTAPTGPVILRGGRVEEAPTNPLVQMPAVIGALFTSATMVVWTLFSGIPILAAIALNETPKYLSNVGGVFFFGVLWVLGVVFSVIGFRIDAGRRHRIVSLVGLGLGVLIAAPVIAAAVLYATS